MLIGRWGEAKAAEFLQNKGYTLIGANYRTRFGEIDLIARDEKYIMFIEVKLRKNADFARASEAVSRSKAEKIRITAEIWLSENDAMQQPRFDVIEVYAGEGINTKNPRINHIENAF